MFRIIDIELECKVKPKSRILTASSNQRTPVLAPDRAKATMAKRYTISQLARAAEVPTSTLRYYERIALIQPEDRSEGNYRLYGDESFRKLKFIRAAQAIGFTLDDVKALLVDDAGRLPTCGNVRRLIEDRLAEIENRLKDLRHVQKVLKNALQQCRKQKKSECCQVVASLQKSR